MSRFRIDHPSKPNIYCEAGVDHAIGIFIELRREDRIRAIKSLDLLECNRVITFDDVLKFLVDHGFFGRDELLEALTAYAEDQDVDSLPDGVARAVIVIMELKVAMD